MTAQINARLLVGTPGRVVVVTCEGMLTQTTTYTVGGGALSVHIRTRDEAMQLLAAASHALHLLDPATPLSVAIESSPASPSPRPSQEPERAESAGTNGGTR